MKRFCQISAPLLVLSLPGMAVAQNITVTVNGEVVPFTGQPPVQQGGSVLVPLRGVFEKLGAVVNYYPATKSIQAVKNATIVNLRLGSPIAEVNGQEQRLAQPAQAVNGTTLVPLRFVSEALGASVRWSGETRTVIINTEGNTRTVIGTNNPTNTSNTEALQVTSLTHDAGRLLRGGETMTVTLNGTPGGNATFTIPGIEGANNVAMQEAAPGRYTGSFRFPAGANVKGATVLATLRKNGQTSPTLQAGQQVTVDAVGPTISNLSPAPDAALAPGRPVIYGTLSDTGTGVNTKQTRILLNGKDVSGDATITEAFVSYRPSENLDIGKDTVTIVAVDAAGNETRREWSFNVSQEAALIREVTFLPTTETLQPGDVLTVRVAGRPNGVAKFSVGSVVTDQPMSEQSPGVYVGNYTVKRGDSLAQAPVSATLTLNGQTVGQTAGSALTIAAGAPDKPTILTPDAGAVVGDSLTVTGKAAPNATVRYEVRYQGRLLVLPVKGTIANGEVTTNDQGIFRIENVKVTPPAGVSNLSYEVAVTAVGAAGELSDATIVALKK